MSPCRLLVVVAIACGLTPANACAADQATMEASFSPLRLGVATTVMVGFQIDRQSPTNAPLSSVTLQLPAGVGAGTNSLGIATCAAGALETRGPAACPTNALLGWGSANVDVVLGSETISEPVRLSIFMAPAVDEHTTVVFYASGSSPVISRLVFEGALLGSSGLFGAQLQASIPPVATLPGSPDAALVSMRSQFGPKGLRYYQNVHGRLRAYVPESFRVPASCPAGGFPFAALLTFSDGQQELATTKIRCPRATPRRTNF